MKLKVSRYGLVIASAFAMATLLPQAHASTIFTLTVNGCSTSCGAGPFGTITLDQTTSTLVTVTEVLAANERFAGSGAGDALEFNVTGPVTIANITSGFAIGPAPDTASTFGTFLRSVTCTTCTGGNAGNPPGPLSFTVTSATGVTIADFIANAGGYYFAADIVAANGNTGNVGANTFVNQLPPPSTPEPFSASLVGAGIAGLCWFKSRRSKSSV
jgi:hypothetical protein